jgi:hypothetical protein
MEKNMKNTKTVDVNKEIRKQPIKNISEVKTEAKRLDAQKDLKPQKAQSKIRKIFQQKAGKLQ